MIFVLGAALVVLIMFVAIIRPLMNKNEQAEATLEERKRTEAYYAALFQANSELEAKIQNTKNGIMDIEASLLPEVETYSAEQYLIDTFRNNDLNFTKRMTSEEIACEDIHMPNGKVANEKLKLKRITVEFSTTDGFNIWEFDGNPAWLADGAYNEEVIKTAIANIGNPEPDAPYAKIKGYDEFINGLDEVSKKFPTSVKIHSCAVEDTGYGFLKLTAEIDCYSTDLAASRLLDVNDSRQIKFKWEGPDSVDCSGGMIGMPLLVTNENSAFYGTTIAISSLQDFVDRPFASYFSSAIIADMAAKHEDTGLWGDDGKPFLEDYDYNFDELGLPKSDDAAAPADGADAAAASDAGEEPAA